jgi:hypothetical protein
MIEQARDQFANFGREMPNAVRIIAVLDEMFVAALWMVAVRSFVVAQEE